MKLYYCALPTGNFGDDLNTFLWPRLMPGAFDGCVARGEARSTSGEDFSQEYFVGIGTIIDDKVPAAWKKHVVGSGIGYGQPPVLDDSWRIHCVRGPLTARALNLSPAAAITDPAVLVRLLPLQTEFKTYNYAFMPHWSMATAGQWQSICREFGVHFIDPRWSPTRVIQEIGRARTLITEALHGAIVSDTLGVPWVPVSSGHAVLDFKWKDWTSSMELSYTPIRIPALWEPKSGLRSKFTALVKRSIARSTLEQILRAPNSNLSAHGMVADRVDRILSVLERFCADHGFQLNSTIQFDSAELSA